VVLKFSKEKRPLPEKRALEIVSGVSRVNLLIHRIENVIVFDHGTTSRLSALGVASHRAASFTLPIGGGKCFSRPREKSAH
jgi:hypothetical protein